MASMNRGLAAEIASRLRTSILNGEFGPGERLFEETLAASMEVSRGPIREALTQLEREGLVVIRPNRGTFVARLTRSDVDELYSLRRALERLAVQTAIQHATEGQLIEMQTIVNTMAVYVQRGITEQEAAELDIRFHDLIYQASNHQRLYESWANLRPQIHVLLLTRNVASADFRASLAPGHQVILDGLRDRDEARLTTEIEKHLRFGYDRVVNSYEQRGSPPITQ